MDEMHIPEVYSPVLSPESTFPLPLSLNRWLGELSVFHLPWGVSNDEDERV